MKHLIDKPFITAVREGRVLTDVKELTTITDAALVGFVIRVRPKIKNGRRVGNEKRVSYAVKYGAGARGKSRWYHIGADGKPYLDPLDPNRPKVLDANLARQEAIRLLGEKNAGKDPALQRREARVAPFLGDFCKKVYQPWTLKNRGAGTVSKNASQINNLLPDFGGKRLTEITSDMVDTFHKSKSATPSAADNAVKMLSAILNHARDVAKVLPETFFNPCSRVKKNGDNSEARPLEPEELARVWEYIDAGGAEAGALFRVLLFTGLRVGEGANLRRSDLSYKSGRAHILRKMKKTKVAVQIPPLALKVLNALPVDPERPDFYFPGAKANGEAQAKTTSAFEYAWQAVREAAEVPDATIHWLRHTFASYANAKGWTQRDIAALLGHSPKSPATTAHYMKVLPGRAAAAADTTAKHVLTFKPKTKPAPKAKAAKPSASALRRQAKAREKVS